MADTRIEATHAAGDAATTLGEPEPFSDLFECHFDAIHRYLARRLGVDLADDLTAEAFAIAFRKRTDYDASIGEARPWLYGIATRLAHRHRRREARELRAYARSGLDPAAPSHADRADAQIDARAQGPALAAALAGLSADERDVLLLHAWEDLTYSEVSVALSISTGTVKSRLHRARRRVRAALAERGEFTPTEETANE